MVQLVNKFYYEIFEIHTMPRGIVCLTLRIKKGGAKQFVDFAGYIRLPIGTLTVVIGTLEELPEYASFVFEKGYSTNRRKISITRSFKVIHKRIDAIRDALNHTTLDIFIDGKYLEPYKIGVRYKNKGIYHGVKTNEKTKNSYYFFTDGDKEYTEQINYDTIHSDT